MADPVSGPAVDPADHPSLADADTVVVCTPDLQGRLVGRRVPVGSFGAAVLDGVAVSTCVYGWDITQSVDLLASGALAYTGMHTGMGDLLLRPDLTSLRRATWLDRTAVCLADATELDGSPTPVSPRHLLRTQVERLADIGLHASVGDELELYLFRGTPEELQARDHRDLVPTTTRPADYSILESDELEPFFADLRRRMIAAGIPVEAGQVEWGLGQWETTLVHAPPLEMADRHVLYKLATKRLAARAGLTATFMAKPVDGQPGSSCHVHLSLRDRAGRPLFWDDDAPGHLAPALRHAVGGVLAHAAELMAFYAPTVNAYRRIRGQDANGWGLTWGVDHRFTTVRVVGHTPESLRLEFRFPGADTNPYLTLAGVLASVLDGIRHGTDPGPPETGNPYERPQGAVPQHLGDAVDRFRSSAWVRATFGDDVVEHYATVAGLEWEQFLSAVTDWERRRSFDAI